MLTFKTYGTPRVYLATAGNYHEPLFMTCATADEAARLASELNLRASA